MRDIADILDRHRVKRVPVLRAGRLVGIITRGDLVRALSQVQVSKSVENVDNAALHRALHDRVSPPSSTGRTIYCGFRPIADSHSGASRTVIR
ncbi:MAG: CBS domain-containing protein [Hyphomicrobiaceae bacterium]